jgi:hypothetical protein
MFYAYVQRFDVTNTVKKIGSFETKHSLYVFELRRHILRAYDGTSRKKILVVV